MFDYDTDDTPLLHFPRLLLWRVDVSFYVLFVLGYLALTSAQSILNTVITAAIAVTVVFTLFVDVCLRLQARGVRVSLSSIWSSLFTSSGTIVYPQQVPPTVHNAPAFLLLTFDWATRLVVTGRERPLEFSDISPMADQFGTHHAAEDRFQPQWEEQLKRLPDSQPSVAMALFKAFGLRLVLGGFLKIVNDICLFISPMLLKVVSSTLQIHSNSLYSRFFNSLFEKLPKLRFVVH